MSCPERSRQRAVLAVAADRAVHEPGVLLAQALVADAEAVEHPGAEGLEQHVGVAHQAQQHLAAPLVLEVDADRALVAVQGQEQRRAGARLGALVVRRRPAHVVAQAGVLDLDHVGAEVGQQQRAEPAGQQPRQVQHADPVRAAGSRALRSDARPPRGAASRTPSICARLGHRRRAPPDVLRSAGGPWRSARRWSAPSCRREGRSCPPARRGSSRPASARPPPASTGAREMPITPQCEPGGHVVGHRGEVARGGRDPAGHPHHEVDVQRLGAARPCRSAAPASRRGRRRSTRARA